VTGADESTADDGAIFAFWAAIERRAAEGRPPFDLDRAADVLEAVREFDRGEL
jgi:hypothetical protein